MLKKDKERLKNRLVKKIINYKSAASGSERKVFDMFRTNESLWRGWPLLRTNTREKYLFSSLSTSFPVRGIPKTMTPYSKKEQNKTYEGNTKDWNSFSCQIIFVQNIWNVYPNCHFTNIVHEMYEVHISSS